MLNKSRTDRMLNAAFALTVVYSVAMSAYSVYAGEWLYLKIVLLTICLIYTAQILYMMDDTRLFRHKPEVFRYDCSNKTVVLKSSPYFIGNAPIHVFFGEKLIVTTWRGNTVEFKVPIGADSLTVKSRAETDEATIEITEAETTYLYIRPINKTPVKWLVSDLDEAMSVDTSSEYEDYENLRKEFRSMNTLTLIVGSTVTIATLISIVVEIML